MSDFEIAWERGYKKGRKDAVEEYKEKSFDLIENIILENEKDITKGMTIYAQIMNTMNNLEEQIKEHKE